MALAVEEYSPYWLEEPILADQPIRAWLELAGQCTTRLAGGENLRGEKVFEEVIRVGAL